MNLAKKSAVSLLALGVVAGLGFVAGQRHANAQAPGHVYELRTYVTPEGKLDDLEKRFRDHTLKLFEKHGMKNVIYTVPMEGPESKNTLIYLLEHKSRTAADQSWKDFQADPDWVKARTASEVNGKLTTKVERKFLAPTDFSPMK